MEEENDFGFGLSAKLAALTLLLLAAASPSLGGSGGSFLQAPLARLRPSPPPSPPPSAQDVAVLYYGVPGWYTDLETWSGLAPHMHAARAAWPSHQRHIYANNRAAGWTVTPFFHTWELGLLPEMLELYRPAAHSAGPGADASGVNRSGGRFGLGLLNSVELGLLAVQRHEREARGGLPFHRILITRFDSYWSAPFEFSKLEDDDALYLASFCNAMGAAVEPPPEGAEECRRLQDSRMNDNGVGDLYFAGSPAVLARMFVGLVAEQERGLYAWKGFWKPHGPLYDRMQHLQLPTRRYLLTHYSVEILRMALHCGTEGGVPDGEYAGEAALPPAHVYNQCGAGNEAQNHLLLTPMERVLGPGTQGSANLCATGVVVCTCSPGFRARAYAREACNVLHDFHFRGGLTDVNLRRECDRTPAPGGLGCRAIG
jgi:hypothetical protein